ncbi:ExeM/NucH family extracellular endonuclease [Thalassococcus sp. S3]|uniref:ExeM/NucH family extracellular endonuclease n=1 Tax=Thalassococcus sp. S3 TaxID=2017482 RepID=UPI001C2C4CE3|nr:ExeM/NucH family extracellular endonuclease [Thalassococcus sp. S3]
MSYFWNTYIFGSFSSDLLEGNDKRNLILGFGGDDTIEAGGGRDTVFGGFGDDLIDGGRGNDKLYGGLGDDTIVGGAGNDKIYGGFGFDVAVYDGGVSDYKITIDGFGVRSGTVVKSVNPDVGDPGRDKLWDVEALYFAGDDYTLFLDGRNNAVLAGDDTVVVGESGPQMIDADALLANDREFDGDTIQIISVTAQSAEGATVTLVNGQLVYDAGTLFEALGAGETATDRFSYTVDDGRGGTDTATVTVTIEGENDAPVILAADTVSVVEGNTDTKPILSASDAEGDTLNYTISGGADAALFEIDAETGTLSFLDPPAFDTPLDADGDNGYEVEITVGDGNGGTATKMVEIEVTEPAGAPRQTVAFDMVGSSSENLTSFTNTAPAFSSLGDGFGKYQVGVSGSIPFAIVDDSNADFAGDQLGIIDASSNTDEFFGVVDTENGDNSGPVSATWSFDIAGFEDLSLSVDVGAMGDFEADDSFTLSYNIDGGAEVTLFEFRADEDASQTYTLADGDDFTLSDPLTVAGSGEVLTNILQTLSADLDGTGAELNVTLTATADGGSEAFAMQNLIIEASDDVTGTSSYDVVSVSGDDFEGDTGTTAYTFEVTREGDLSSAGSVDFAVAGDVDAEDFGGTPPSGTVHFAPGQSSVTFTVEIAGDTTNESDEVLEVVLSNPVAGTIDTGSATATVLNDDDITLISEVQGDGASSDLVGAEVTVEAIVTYVTEGGYYIQEEDSDADGNANTSEGIFVKAPASETPQVGDKVTLRGTVGEDFGETAIEQQNVRVLSSGNVLPSAALVLLGPDAQDFEAIEGMRFTLESGVEGEEITIIENFNFDRFGEISVSAGIQTQPTQLFDAQDEADEVAALAEANANNRLIIDDGRSEENPDEFAYIANTTEGDNGNGILDKDDTFTAEGPTLRLGAEIDGPTTGVMTFGFGEYRMLVEGTLDIDESTNSEARPDTPDPVGGDIQIASINVLNYFTTLRGDPDGSGPNGLDPRGAGTQADLDRQTDKLVDAILGTEAEVFALQEIENGGFADGAAIDALVDALNAEAQARGDSAVYAFVDPTNGDPDGFIGTDAITTGIIYDTTQVNLVTSDYLVFDEPSAETTFQLADVMNPFVDSDFQVGDFQRNRPAVAATFEDAQTGETFTVVSNHFKSKGDSDLEDLVEAAQDYLDEGGTGFTQADIDALIADPNYDQGDGQAFWNQVRMDASEELKAWLETGYAGTGADDYLILGDLNAYAKEDPVQTLADDPGLVDLIDSFVGQDNAYSFVFDGQRGALDHALASDDLAGRVTGLTEWHINADEPDLLGYNSRFTDAGFYEPSRFASSDHDPLILGLDTGRADDLIVV